MHVRQLYWQSTNHVFRTLKTDLTKTKSNQNRAVMLALALLLLAPSLPSPPPPPDSPLTLPPITLAIDWTKETRRTDTAATVRSVPSWPWLAAPASPLLLTAVSSWSDIAAAAARPLTRSRWMSCRSWPGSLRPTRSSRATTAVHSTSTTKRPQIERLIRPLRPVVSRWKTHKQPTDLWVDLHKTSAVACDLWVKFERLLVIPGALIRVWSCRS